MSNVLYRRYIMSVSTRRKTPLGTQKTKKKNRRQTIYESALKHIQLSSKRWQQIQAQKRLIRNGNKASGNKRKSFSPKKNEFLQDSVIILSDNECTSNEGVDKIKCVKNTRVQKRPFKESNEDKQCLSTINKTLSQRKSEEEIHPKKRRKKSIIALSDNNSSCLLISDTEDPEITTIDLDDENIAPSSDSVNQGSDDIVVLWSSTKTSSLFKDSSDEDLTHLEKDRLFMIDCNPDPKNLSCLEVAKEITREPYEKNVGQKNTKKKEEEYFLPFSKRGLKFPKAFNVSKKIAVKKPTTTNRIKKFKCLESKSSTTNTIPVICNLHVTSPLSTNMLHEPSNAGLSVTELCTPELLQTDSSNSQSTKKLREIVIDGNNVAMAHRNGRTFSEAGLKLVIDYFQQRGHSVKVFVPQHRRSQGHKLLEKLYTDGIVVFTPSRSIGGRWITPYDDRFILEYATMCGGIVVSLDQYRDLYMEKPEWRDTIENRLLAPTFVGDYVMFPEDPLGRKGPKLHEFLKY